MAPKIILFLVAISAVLTAAPHVLTLPHEATTLPNGIRVYLIKYPSPGTIAYQLPVRAGSRNEVEKGKSGFAHFFEHLMFRGTKKMTGKQFGDLYSKLGAENNAWTWFDLTNYHGTVAQRYIPKIIAAEADRFANLQFDEKALRDEAGAVLGEYNKSVAGPEFLLEEKLLATVFTTHTYGHTTMGYKEDVLQFTERYKDVWPFFKRYYRPSNISVILVGDVDFKRELRLIQSKFGSWKDPKMDPVTIPEEPPQVGPRTASVKLNKPAQTRFTIAFRTPAFSTKSTDAAAKELLTELGFSIVSDFQKTYRFQKKWLDAVEIGPFPMQSRDAGLWSLTLRLSESGESHREDVLDAVNEVIEQFRTKDIAPEKLAAVKKRFKNAAVTGWFESPEALAGKIAWYTSFEQDLGVIDRHFQRVEEVTAQALREFATKYFIDAAKTTITLEGEKRT